MNHDVPITRDAIKPFWIREDREQYRYADNLVYRAQSVIEGKQVLAYARRLLMATKLALKEDGGVYDLNTGLQTPLLGFVLSKDRKEMTFEPDNQALVRLRQHLTRCHDSPNPVLQARLALRGWVASMGPAFPCGKEILTEVSGLASRLGLRESYSRMELEKLWHASWMRWCSLIERAASGYAQRQVGYRVS